MINLSDFTNLFPGSQIKLRLPQIDLDEFAVQLKERQEKRRQEEVRKHGHQLIVVVKNSSESSPSNEGRNDE